MRLHTLYAIAGLLVIIPLVAEGQAAKPPVELPPFSVQTQVMKVTPDGAVVPLVDAPVWVVAEQVEPAMGRPKRTAVGRFQTTTSARIADFSSVRSIRDAVYTVQCVWGGISYRSSEFRLGESGPVELRVYEATTDTSAIRLSSLYELTVSDTMLYVTQLVRVFNESNQTVDYNYSPDGLRLPTLAFQSLGGCLFTGCFLWGKCTVLLK